MKLKITMHKDNPLIFQADICLQHNITTSIGGKNPGQPTQVSTETKACKQNSTDSRR